VIRSVERCVFVISML